MRTRRHALLRVTIGTVGLLVLAGTISTTARQAAPTRGVLRLATTTSTADTGLLAALLPDFERQCRCRVDVVAVGTGQALELGRRGDADVLLVHARDQEDAFVAAGSAARRDDVMYNDFVIIGPEQDPAGVARTTRAADALKAVAGAKAPFASRGDKSGTHTKELALWKTAGVTPAADQGWYLSVGQGMGETLTFANERGAYALADRATWLSMRARLGSLRLLLGGATLADNPDRDLRNDYGVMAVSSAKQPAMNAPLAAQFVEWLLSKPTQDRIGAFGIDRFGQRLFYPNSEEGKATRELRIQIGPVMRTLTLNDLKALRKVALADHEVVGVKRGSLGRITWAGASLADALMAVDRTIADPRHTGARVLITSSDGWTASMKWVELFGDVSAGERLYLAKGCNECHGADGEGSAPAGQRPAPMLANRAFDASATAALVRDKARHAGIYAYTPASLSDPDLAAMLAWLARPAAAPVRTGRNPASASDPTRVTLLAYERDGKPMAGRDGLIQLVVGSDEFASRYSHWVASITVR